MINRLCCAGMLLALSVGVAVADEPVKPKVSAGQPVSGKAKPVEAGQIEKALTSATPLNQQKTVWLDKAAGKVFLKTTLVLREGLLEMLLCKKQTKEHESILSIDTEARFIHAALLAAGAKPGHPVRFQPEFQKPEGDRLEIWVHWTDPDKGPQRALAQSWIRSLTRRYYVEKIGPLPKGVVLPVDGDLRYDPMEQELIWFGIMSSEQEADLQKLTTDPVFRKALASIRTKSQPRPMVADFVFAGSAFAKQTDGTEWYTAEGGNLICVANFADAIIDVSIQSSDVNDQALFEPNTPVLPPHMTEVIVELIPARGQATSEAK